MAQNSKYQQKIISNYYENLDTIKLNKLQEIVSELYLVESPKKADRLWQRAQSAMEVLKMPASVINNVIKKRDVVVLAKVVNDLAKKK